MSRVLVNTMSKATRLARQEELLKLFCGDFYQEKEIEGKIYVKNFNRGTGRWQVAIYSQESFKKYNAFKEKIKHY